MNRLRLADRVRLLGCLSEGLGVRPTARVIGCSINTVQKMIVDAGLACQAIHDTYVRGLPCRKIQADEMWAFCYARKKNLPKNLRGVWGYGDVWLWSTICETTKIVPAYCYAPRNAQGAIRLMNDLAPRLKNRIELNTDGFSAYWEGTWVAFKTEIDYAKIIKVYETPNGRWNANENRYQQPDVIAVRREKVCGNPTVSDASTSYIERLNLGTRMHNKKMSRLTNGHAKKLAMLEHSTAIQFCHYNFIRPHAALDRGTTPAMACGIADRPWTWEDVLAVVDDGSNGPGEAN